ncbi:TBC1 domain family member 25-like isoform X2 [Uloborus diversus]|uniref:TBC1 domain family member 25-like isoform X2 n=1 Tax=Uloborus diversus TaxID=327109 RepID=UPI002409070A|nr:TBC1 domain family member 25-like isoform X2 [Uloborus diversus]
MGGFLCVSCKNDAGQKRTTCETFNLDPQAINYNSLRNTLARIFKIEGEFTISFKKDKEYVPLTSDWDLDGAIFEASKPYLSLAIESLPIDKTLEEWDIICPADIPPMELESSRCSEERRSLAGSIISQMESAMQRVQRALSLESSCDERQKLPLDEIEFKNLQDKQGRILNHRELHMSVFQGGVEPSMRPTVWKHLLNVFPHGMTEEERDTYLNSKSAEYYRLRYRWQHLIHRGKIPDVLQDITNLVRKDVRRTDRTEKFYAGSDDNENVKALFNILTTYAVNHPSVSYCQGMSDLLSPILYVMKKEAHAYICFCGLMKRTQSNFKLDGRSMKLKFRHLQRMIRFYDKELYTYLKNEGALDLLFCYRWLLLDLKREFPYQEMLSMKEVLWGSLPPKPPQTEIELYEVKFPTAAICSPFKDRTKSEDRLKFAEDHFGTSHDGHSLSQSMSSNPTAKALKKWAMRVRRESIARNMDSSGSITEGEIKLPVHYKQKKYRKYITGKLGRLNRNASGSDLDIRIPKKPAIATDLCMSYACGEVFSEQQQVMDVVVFDAHEYLRTQWCYSNTVNEIQLNNWLNGRRFQITECAVGGKDGEEPVVNSSSNRHRHGSNDSNYGTLSEGVSSDEEGCLQKDDESDGYSSDGDSKEASTVEHDYDSSTDDYESYDDFLDSMAGRQYEEVNEYFDRKKEMLPPPHVLGDGNPFLLFLCVELIEQHREEIFRRKLDFNELGIYFDKLVRKHKFPKALKKAQKMFREYLNMGWDVEDVGNISDSPDF